MGRSGKRKHPDDRLRRDTDRMGLGEPSQHVKRPRLSPDERFSPDMDRPQQSTAEDGEWQTVRSKNDKKRHKQESQRKDIDDGVSPSLYFQHKPTLRDPLRINNLRDLALYVLADGTAPTWVALKRAREIERVVVMMLPGLDEAMIERAKVLLKDRQQPAANGHPKTSVNDDGLEPVRNAGQKQGDVLETTPRDGSEENRLVLEDIEWLLHDILPVKAPSDPQQTKVYSPLQAMLIKSFDDIDKQIRSKQPDRGSQSVRTAISEFIHTADELRDAEYPIHPAAFTSEADAALEKSRRQNSGQAVSDGWVDSRVGEAHILIPPASLSAPRDAISQGLTIYAIDCEMVLTSDEKSSLARISVISWPDGKVMLDEYVKPSLPIVNYFTQYSGITEQILENVATSLPEIQAKLLDLLTPSTILLGHSLESDLNAMKLTHPFIIDTSMIYPHPRGLPLRSSLKFLANKYLKREIQKGGADGHNSVEDAKAVLDLVKLKCEKGPKWGTNEANGETVFKLLSRKWGSDGKPRTSAIVEYGTPERGFGKEATYAIGCQNDKDIAKNTIRAAEGDEDSHEIPKGGVNFVWGRLRALEFARGWGASNYTNHTSTTTAAAAASTTTNDSGKTTTNDITNTKPEGLVPPPTATEEGKPHTTTIEKDGDNDNEFDTPLLQTLTHLSYIHSSLSTGNNDNKKKTLLILYSGTSDVRPLMSLQAQQAQYRREFKTKKWDELTVKWTDTEERMLRKSVDDARKGWGWIGIV